jgi:RNA polymerase sigma-54 factor
MQLSQSLRLKQKQSMVMTPRLQQAIRMLQMNNLDLQTYLETEALENPFMEVQQADTNNDTLPSIQEDSEAEAFNGAASDTGLDRAIQDGTAMVEDKTPATAENVQETNQYESAEFDFESRLNSQMSTMSQAAENDWDMISTRISERAISLMAHVEKQIELSQMSESQKILAYVLASHIEPSGWLGKPLEDIAEEKGLDIDDLMPILQNLQSLEPTGIFARDLKECLRLQALEQKKITPQV